MRNQKLNKHDTQHTVREMIQTTYYREARGEIKLRAISDQNSNSNANSLRIVSKLKHCKFRGSAQLNTMLRYLLVSLLASLPLI